MKVKLAIAGLVAVAAMLLWAQTAVTPVSLTDGQQVTVSCSASTPTNCPPVAPVPSGHEDHYARHRDQVNIKGRAFCATCHVTGGKAVAHGDRAFLAPGMFVGPHACYTAPWGAPGFPAVDPFGTETFPNPVCAPDPRQPHLAVFNNGTLIQCIYCHNGSDD